MVFPFQALWVIPPTPRLPLHRTQSIFLIKVCKIYKHLCLYINYQCKELKGSVNCKLFNSHPPPPPTHTHRNWSFSTLVNASIDFPGDFFPMYFFQRYVVFYRGDFFFQRQFFTVVIFPRVIFPGRVFLPTK